MDKIQPTTRVRDSLASILALALAVVFLITGTAKVVGYSDMVADFARWGYPAWLVILASALEVTGALLILAPRLATLGAMLLSVSMVGAFTTHLIHAQGGKMLLTGILLFAVIGVAVLRWDRSILQTPPRQSDARSSV